MLADELDFVLGVDTHRDRQNSTLTVLRSSRATAIGAAHSSQNVALSPFSWPRAGQFLMRLG